jgi:hypothetical protein
MNVVSLHMIDWEDFYCGAKQVIPPNMPKPRGRGVEIHCFVNADHAGHVARIQALSFFSTALPLYGTQRSKTR